MTSKVEHTDLKVEYRINLKDGELSQCKVVVRDREESGNK